MESQRGPIINRLFEAMDKSGIKDDSERRRLIKEITGVSKQNLLHWFNGTTTTPGVDHLAKLSEFFNIDLNWLITGASRTSAHNKHNGKQGGESVDPNMINRITEGITQSGIPSTDVRASLLKNANELWGISYNTVEKWLRKELEPSTQQLAMLCEYYGIAIRYVSIGKGPVMALDYIRAVENRNPEASNEVINLQDVALLGNV